MDKLSYLFYILLVICCHTNYKIINYFNNNNLTNNTNNTNNNYTNYYTNYYTDNYTNYYQNQYEIDYLNFLAPYMQENF
jgi:hypothetical protein